MQKPTFVALDEVDSTNLYLKREVRDGHLSRAMVWAERQSAGRGRLGRTWHSPVGGLYLSVATPLVAPAPILYSVAVGVAAAEWLRSLGAPVWLKWPNDLLAIAEAQTAIPTALSEPDAQEYKLGGILAELLSEPQRAPHVLVGIGLNVNAAIPDMHMDQSLPATHLAMLLERSFALRPAAETLGRRIFDIFAEIEADTVGRRTLLRRWRTLSRTLGTQVRIEKPNGEEVRGEALDVDADFGLLVQPEGEPVQTVSFGDCYHLRKLQ